VEARVTEAEEMERHAEQMKERGFDVSSISLEDSLESTAPLRPRVEGDQSFLKAVKSGYARDSVLSKVAESPNAFPQFSSSEGLIYARNVAGKWCLAIPCDVRLYNERALTEIVISQAHATLGHLGKLRTAEYVRQWYRWPKMGIEIASFCDSCGACAMSKTLNQAPAGLLHSLPIPCHPWDSVGMDFVGPFPSCLGYNYLLVVIC
jgi:hypothetical protein